MQNVINDMIENRAARSLAALFFAAKCKLEKAWEVDKILKIDEKTPENKIFIIIDKKMH